MPTRLTVRKGRDCLSLQFFKLERGIQGADVVVIGASAGGLSALSVLLAGLPADFAAAILIVQHLAPQHKSLLAEILARISLMPVKQAQEGEAVEPGKVYIAPPDRHLLVSSDRTLTLSQSELVHFLRPSVDLLFESVATCYKARAIAVVLTGTGSDGSMGVRAIKKMGGTVIAQDEQSSQSFGMPRAAIKTGEVDLVLPLDQIASVLVTLVSGTEDD